MILLRLIFTIVLLVFRLYIIFKVISCLYLLKTNPDAGWEETHWYLAIMVLDYYCIRVLEKDEN